MRDEPGQERLRLFVAAALPSDLRREVLDFQERLRRKIPGVRWVRADGIHITLKFLGWVESDRLCAIERLLQSEAESAEPMELELSGPGVFPRPGAPRVLWIGVREEGGMLSALQERLERGFERLGFPREGRPFSPHLTLGRVEKRVAPGGVERMLEEEAPRGRFSLKEIDLMRSELKPEGAVYTKRLTVGLGRPWPSEK
jgi:2'-5' RNA ligase